MLFSVIWRHLKRALDSSFPSPLIREDAVASDGNLNNCTAASQPDQKPAISPIDDDDEQSPSVAKRSRLDYENQPSNLDQLLALRQLLTCNVCFDVAKQANQCANGHLICLACSSRLEQVSFSTDEAKAPCACPVCRVSLCNAGAMSNHCGGMQRCLLAEKLAAELPVKCRHCDTHFPRKMIEAHQRVFCSRRCVNCKFAWLGCEWRGFAKDLGDHVAACAVLDQKTVDVVEEVYNRMHGIASSAAHRLQVWRGLLQLLEERQQIRFGRRFFSGLRLALLPISLDKIPHDRNETFFKSPIVCMPMVGKYSLWVQVTIEIFQTESTSMSPINGCEALYSIEVRRAKSRPNMARHSAETSLSTNHVYFSIIRLRSESLHGCEEELDLLDSWHRYAVVTSVNQPRGTNLNNSTATANTDDPKLSQNRYRLSSIPESEFDHILGRGGLERLSVELLTSRDNLQMLLALAIDPGLFTTAKDRRKSGRVARTSGGANRRDSFPSSSSEEESTEPTDEDDIDDEDDDTVTYLLAEDMLTSRRTTARIDADEPTGVTEGPDRPLIPVINTN